MRGRTRRFAVAARRTRPAVVTDHASLQYLQTTTAYSKRLARWVDEFQEYDLKIQYRKGSDGVAPDTLSRRPVSLEMALPTYPNPGRFGTLLLPQL
ncbi:hypothetical protein PENSUB_6712 [Penicillium subrubescens]|uniref:Reverse transcriptase RNase H-like domain-containing protein n=1 Tax=Penicillium subrubescens TaxID=1316194 RepID=A0A1Q5TXK2_9EURO|nr:hypothetical protein PENSUB_6712 [Penicillium subrubescens]